MNRNRVCCFLGLLLTLQAAIGSQPSTDAIDVVQHHLALSIDVESRTIGGDQRITVRNTGAATDAIRFSPNRLVIESATLGERPLRVERELETVLHLPRALKRGETATLRIVYRGTPARGIVFGKQSVYTSYFACDWMFCQQDRPGDKARFALALTVPRGWRSFGIADRKRVEPGPNASTETHTWEASADYSSYLYGFAAGRFNAAADRAGKLELDYLSEDASSDQLRTIFASTPAMVRFFEQRAGVALSQPRYAQVLVAGDAAQEAAHFSILGRDVVMPILTKPDEDWALAHELAHQWWGNLVTCKDWTHFWLNEGITTFMVAAWKEQRWGREAYDAELGRLRDRVRTARSAGFDVPLTYSGPYPSQPVRRAIIYSKGALFMDHLRQQLGDDRFWQALRDFTRTYAGETVDSRDFQRIFERASGRSLAPLFDEWVY